MPVIRRVLLTSVLVVAVAGACSDDGDTPAAGTTTSASVQQTPDTAADWLGDVTTAPTTPAGLGAGWGEERGGRTPLQGFGEVAAMITAADGTECEVCLLAATTAAQRSRGLMEVTDEDLGGYDGMVFVFEEDATSGFWMRNTRLPLSIAYFDASGALVSQADMAPCPDTSQRCPSYAPDGPFRYAVEVPQGRLPDIGVTGEDGALPAAGEVSLEITGTPCPGAAT